MNKFAAGKHAKGLCDRCGLTFKLNELKFQVVNRKVTGLRVCSACKDIDHEQYRLGEIRIEDPQALENARPDRNLAVQRSIIYGWNPVMGPELTVSLGSVTVEIT
jgi:hypothetical protein